MNYLPLSCVCKWAVGSSNVIFGALAVNLFSIEFIYREVIKKTQLQSRIIINIYMYNVLILYENEKKQKNSLCCLKSMT